MAREQERVPSRSVREAEEFLELGSGAPPLAAAELEELDTTPVSSPTKDAWRRFRHNWAAMIALVLIIVALVLAIFAPLMHTTDPIHNQNFAIENSGPSSAAWFGGDGLGRDIYSRLLYGLRPPLFVGLIGTAITVFLGALLGVTSGYFGDVVDSVLSRFTDLMFAFPAFVLALITVSLYGPAFQGFPAGAGRLVLLTIVFALVSWPPLMRFVRSLALSMKEQQFIEAARTSGTTHWGILWRHLLPNIWGLILIQGAFIIINVISTETILSILGLGIEPPNPDLGQMLSDGVSNIYFPNAQWQIFFPGAFLAVIILCFSFLADGLRDAVDPRGKQ